MAAMPLGEWTRRLGALLAEAYDCFMVGTLRGSTEYKRGSRVIARGQWRAPLGSSRLQTTRSRQFAAALALVKDKPSAALKKPVLDPRCARRRRQYAIRAEECSRRSSNKRMNKQGAKNDVRHP
jgi:hypothetical protein